MLRVSENSMLKRIFGPKGDEVTGEWTQVHNEGLNDLYSPSNFIRVIKSRRMRWPGHVACLGESKGAYRFWCGKLSERGHLEEPGVDGRIILNCIYRNFVGRHGLD